jgi:hypothetical protein
VRRVIGTHCTASRWSFPKYANSIGDVTSRPEATSPPRAATS